jgi:parvulin-like peptidyl-prolyl isomerase
MRLSTTLPHRSTTLLCLGALAGALLAASGLVENQLNPLDAGIIASVDGEAIYLAQYQSHLELLQRDRRQALSRQEREQVLQRLVEERLLIRRAEQSGLTRSETAVRKAIVDAMIENAVIDTAVAAPTEGELQTFYSANSVYFTPAALLQVRRLVFRGEDADQRAASARRDLLAGLDFDAVQRELANPGIVALPSSPIPANRLQNYLGPSLTEAAVQLPSGGVSPVLSNSGALVLLQVVQSVPAQQPPLAAVREQVLREYQRRRRDEALQDYLQELRAEADIRVNESLLGAGP